MRRVELMSADFFALLITSFLVTFCVLVMSEEPYEGEYDNRAYSAQYMCTTDSDCGCTDDCLEPLIYVNGKWGSAPLPVAKSE